MSYILDALNRSNQERERNQVPGLDVNADADKGKRLELKHFILGFVLLVVFNSVGVYLYFGDSEPVGPNNTSETSGTIVIADTPQPVEITPAPAPSTSTPIAAPPAALSGPVLASDLPGHVQARLPDLEVTAHIYASDPDLRMVKIDGVSRQEGDLVNNSLQLVEITETGVVMNFEGYAYFVNIIEAWQETP